MKDNLNRYTLRVDLALSDKLGYIANYEGRTKNRELEQMIKIQFRFGCTNSRRRIAPQAPDLKRFSGMEKVHRDPKSRWTHGGE